MTSPVFHNGVAAVNISYADFVPERGIVQCFDPQDVRLPPTTTSSLILTDLSSVAVLSSADICNASKAGRGT